jgi:hypothetical protein
MLPASSGGGGEYPASKGASELKVRRKLVNDQWLIGTIKGFFKGS